MKRFVFRLERLERLREVQRGEARATLARAIGDTRDCALAREREEAQLAAALEAALPGELAGDPRALRQLALWRDGRRVVVGAALEAQARADERESAARDRHAEAARAHRVLERLHERRRRRWLEQAALEERKYLDEIHLQRLARRGDGNREDGPGKER